MTGRAHRILLMVTAALALLTLALLIAHRNIARDPLRPEELPEVAAWLADHPADWMAASAITDQALDSDLPQRMELWRESHRLAARLAPLRPNTRASFVRAGLFHWYELDASDRAAVLQAAEPLMRNPTVFAGLYVQLWELTHDMGWLRRVAPDDPVSLRYLRELALSRGKFDDYRELREVLRRKRMEKFLSLRASSTLPELLQLLPSRIEAADEPLVRALLEELDRRPFDPQQVTGRMEDLASYAVEHDLEPLAGLQPLLQVRQLRDVTRARLALALGDGAEATTIEVTSAVPGSAEWTRYYLDRARFEAAHGDAAVADRYLGRAALAGMTPEVLATAASVATTLGKNGDAARYAAQLDQLRRSGRAWSGTCGNNELCATAATTEFLRTAGDFRIQLSVVQTDRVPPYVEIYVDDTLAAEGAIPDHRTFVINAAPGLHHVEVLLANPHVRRGIERRLRLS